MFDISELTTHIFKGTQPWVQQDPSYARSRFSVPKLRDIAEHLVDDPKGILARQIKPTNENIIGDAKAFVMETEAFETMVKESGQATANVNAAIQHADAASRQWMTNLMEFDNKIGRVPARLQASLEAIETKERVIPELKEPTSNQTHTEKLEKMSKTKMAVIGGAVALGAYAAYALFREKHPEHTPETQQR